MDFRKAPGRLTWLIVSVVASATPSALLLAELGAAYTDEGGPHVRVRTAFGHLAGAIGNFFYWVTDPTRPGRAARWSGRRSVASSSSSTTATNYSTPSLYVIGIPFVRPGVLFAILWVQVGKSVATVEAIARSPRTA